MILRRINLGLFAVFGELSATADWRAHGRGNLALGPGYGRYPDGRAEARWRARRQAAAAFGPRTTLPASGSPHSAAASR